MQKNKKKGKVTILCFIFLQGNQWASPSEEESIMDMQLPLSSSTATPNNQSSEDDHKAPKLYFDVDEAKEKKYATYEDLRKKHRERWNPPSLSSSSQTRKEQVGKVDRLLKRFSQTLFFACLEQWLGVHRKLRDQFDRLKYYITGIFNLGNLSDLFLDGRLKETLNSELCFSI